MRVLVAAMIAALACTARAHAAPVDRTERCASRAGVADYSLAPNDKVRITVFGEQALSGDFPVPGSGVVSFPLVGEVHAAGLTSAQLEAALTKSLANGYMRDPKVSVSILEYRPYYILGEVEKPGSYPYVSGLTAHAAVATAGGFTVFANKNHIYIKPANGDAELKCKIVSNLAVLPGDTIRVGDELF